MALPSSGPLSMAQIATEFGGAVPHSLSEYYGAAAGVPTSGQISISDFYGKSNIVATRVTVTQGVSNNPWLMTDRRGYGQPVLGDGWFGAIAPSNVVAGRVIQGLYYEANTVQGFAFVLRGHHPRDFLADLITQDGWWLHGASSAAFWHDSIDFPAVGPVTGWRWSVPDGGWTGTGTRWVDIYHRTN